MAAQPLASTRLAKGITFVEIEGITLLEIQGINIMEIGGITLEEIRQQVPTYWAAQLSGALLAGVLLTVLLPKGNLYGATIPSVSIVQALGWESVLTFFLMFVIISVATDSRAIGTMAGVAIGAVVTLGAFVGGATTGASMNPARSLIPALLEGRVDAVWIYIIGPTIGAVIAALVYERIRCEEVAEKDLNSDTGKSAKGCC